MKPLHVMLPKARAYVKSYNGQTQWMYFLIEDVSLLEKYNTICHKVSADIKKWFDSELVYNKKILKTKIKSYGDGETHVKEMPKARSDYACLAVITIDSALKKDENIILKCFWKNVNTLKKKWLGILLEAQKFLLMSLMNNKLGLLSFFRAKNISHLSLKRKRYGVFL